jgi:copper chaperone CopZ
MKTAVLSFAAVLALSTTALAKETTESFKASGWHCGGCAGKTEKALKAVKGVTTVKADGTAKTVTVTYDDAVAKSADLEKAVADIGYKIAK